MRSFLVCIFCFVFASIAHCEDLRAVYEQATDAYDHGDFPKAVDLFTQVTEMAPQFAPGYVGLAMSLKSNGADIEEVLYNYKKAIEIDPPDASVLEQAGRLYQSLNKNDKAEDAYVRALKVNPGLTSVKISLAWLYLMARPNPEKAAKYFKEVLKTAPTPNIYFGLGMAYFANNDREKALDMITTLRGMDQEDLAKKLETAVRENRKVDLQIPEDQPQEQPQEDQKDPVVSDQEQAAGTDNPVTPVGVKVRLRDKLSNLGNL